MRIIWIQSVPSNRKPWWFDSLPDLPGNVELVLVQEPRKSFHGWHVYGRLIKQWISLDKYDVVVSGQDGNATFLYSFLNRFRFKKPYRHVVLEFMTREREQMPPVRAFLKYSFLRFALKSVDQFICSAKTEIDYYSEAIGLKRGKFSFVPLSCDPLLLEQETSDKGIYIVSGGRTGRDYDTFLKAVSDLDIAAKVIAGHGGLDGLRVPDNVETLFDIGMKDFVDVLAQSSLVVVPLQNRQISIGQSVILQGMALGKTVITTDVPATREYIVHGEDGVLVPPGDDRALRNAIRNLMDNAEERHTIGQAAREKVKKEFLPVVILPQIIDIIIS